MESSMDPSTTKAIDRAEHGQPDKEAPLRSEDCQPGMQSVRHLRTAMGSGSRQEAYRDPASDVLHLAVTAISFKARCQLMGVYIPRILQLACSGPARPHAAHLPGMLLVQSCRPVIQGVREVIVRARTYGAEAIMAIYFDDAAVFCPKM
ncbi:uncharacterized protein BO96DRAFT_334119 [Aspergillus niger CBS 101883]|uniref:Uncharacterized protein n=2 Tax=Aspergillus niger TaxID=5061 RepID=A2QA00_ASPNC|nr:uncharacterized protein BO96DRAFT_334119 [Aspergillus niger CBS 101883]XP_059599717.1 hypothetical protein An01g09690 [Aspergillus niger]PYH58289.1 hypothetical protein BO96DRAFT_334119 [Aspergillus niger CBS 101883]CAK37152.1 hypothetical protein An01g09690 [Aspergillus niger]